ncbi:hypothetical protein K7462_29450, partial [Pseudomonas fluorescens]|uniref:hypothetical protein n=1 Tax=Pseudomonas fluorescens TaxID=294 RepID=UPI001D21E6B9|nr:hypothetical protein [Pseudomonas fluorescens]
MTDAAHILFPNDTPKPQQPVAASDRAPILRNPVVTVIEPVKAVVPTAPAGPVAAHKPDDAAAKLFKDDTIDSNAKAVTEIL